MKVAKLKKQNFSSFNSARAYKQLNITELTPWKIEAPPVPASDFFNQRLERLKCFDLQSLEESKKLLIDAICEEGILKFKRLKIWKGANLESDTLCGYADYLITERKGYLEAPCLCIIEAKKDDFEQGAAQCLVEMQACQWSNQQVGRAIDIFGIVTNGEGWKFYTLALSGAVHETVLYAVNDIEAILGALNYIFQRCEQNLRQGATP